MPIVLGTAVLGGIALAAVLWNLIAGVILGALVAGWLLVQLWGEITLEWECRRPVHADRAIEQVVQKLPELPARRPRRVIEAPQPRVPIVVTAEVIEVRRER